MKRRSLKQASSGGWHDGARRLARGICLLVVALLAATVSLAVGNRHSIGSLHDANAIQIVLPIGFGLLGALTTWREPANRLGWLSLGMAAAMAIGGLTDQYARWALVTNPGAPYTPWIPLIGHVSQVAVYPAGLAALAFLVTPHGRLPSPGWRWLGWVGAAVTSLLVVVTVTALGDPGERYRTGPVAIALLNEAPLGRLAFLAGLGVLAAAGASIVLRLRRATGDERLQLRWIASGAAVAVMANAAVTLVAILLLSPNAAEFAITLATILSFGVAVPASFAMAILRYRLYDLDLLLNRTVLYGAVGAVVAAVLFVGNLLAQQLAESLLDQPTGLVTTALGVAAGMAFGPLRRAVRPIVDRALPPRGQLALLFADIVESTRAVVDLGDERWRDLLIEFRALVRRELARHGGREVDTAGDAFFAVFHRPTDAVACAIAMREVVGTLGLRLRAGLHIGVVEMRGEHVAGLAVHAAARVMGTAGEGQVLATEATAHALGGEIQVRDAGSRHLRGVPGSWRLFEVIGT